MLAKKWILIICAVFLAGCEATTGGMARGGAGIRGGASAGAAAAMGRGVSITQATGISGMFVLPNVGVSGIGEKTAVVQNEHAALVQTLSGNFVGAKIWIKGELLGQIRVENGSAILYDTRREIIAKAVRYGDTQVALRSKTGELIGVIDYIQNGNKVRYSYDGKDLGWDIIENNEVMHYNNFGELIGKTYLIREPERTLVTAGIWTACFLLGGDSENKDNTRRLVRDIQIELEREGFSPGVIDGILGVNTMFALRLWQEDNGLPQTGIPDSKTTKVLTMRAELSDSTRIKIVREAKIAEEAKQNVMRRLGLSEDELWLIDPKHSSVSTRSGWLGIAIESIPKGIVVRKCMDQIGFQLGDTVIAVIGKPVRRTPIGELKENIESMRPGSKFIVRVLRGKELINILVTLKGKPARQITMGRYIWI